MLLVMSLGMPFADVKQINLQQHLSRHETFLFRILTFSTGSCTDIATSLLETKTSSSCKMFSLPFLSLSLQGGGQK